MRFVDYLSDILGAFRKQRLRTALTAAGIGIGAFAITLMIGLGQGLQTYIEQQFTHFGNDRVLLVFPDAVRAGQKVLDRLAGFGKPAEPLTEKDARVRRISRGGLWIQPKQVKELKALPEVEKVAPLTWLEIDGMTLGSDYDSGEPTWYETDFAALSTSLLIGTPAAGRKPELETEGEVIISPQYARSFNLSRDDLVGREVVIRTPKLSNVQRRFLYRDPSAYREEHKLFRATVVGLTEKTPISRAVFTSLPLGREMARYQSQNPELLSEDKIGFQAHVLLKEGVDREKAKEKIGNLGLMARGLQDSLGELQQVFLVVNFVLTSFGLLALLVATLGIANTLLMAITERTREIGVMKALGMTESTIRRLFAAEAAAIGLVGGLVGMLAAIGLGFGANLLVKDLIPAAQNLEGYSLFYFPAWLLVGAPIFTSLVGGLAGIYPANRAAGLDPIEALRRE